MNCNRLWVLIFLIIAACYYVASPAQADHYVAYSLHEAERRIKAGQARDAAVANLGAITDPVAVVYDEVRRDLLVVGRSNPAKEELVTLDDFVVALRAIYLHKTWPLVSIDKNEQTEHTHQQTVRFEGGIAGTAFGKTLLDADVLLKGLGLGEVPAEVWGVRSLFDLLCDHVRQSAGMPHIRSRVWFIANQEHSSLANRQGVMVIENLVISAESRFAAGTSKTDTQTLRRLDSLSRKFSQSLSANFSELRQAYPQLARLDALFKLVALAAGIHTISPKYESFHSDMAFWMEQYQVAPVPTPKTYPLRIRKGAIGSSGETKTVELDGGVELRALILELNDGSITALRDIVVKSRPKGNPLTWKVPLEAWNAPGADVFSATRSHANAAVQIAKNGDLGCTFDGRISQPGGLREAATSLGDLAAAAHQRRMPEFSMTDRLSGSSSNIGGVMLSGVAKVDGTDGTQVDLAGGNFSLVLDGKNARIAPETYRKFITALWCVYYDDQDPGISIDPIGKESEKHLVRYIGRVINTDLGRVMREADYLMKKWAVGTERPDYPGFRAVDGWMARYGAVRSGISRRFWFVPEDLSFKQGDGLLLFDSGRMLLNTEYDEEGLRGKASKADQEFAGFFTRHYGAIAEKHPVYKELFEYAKMVTLAKYLKQQGVPLHWFLMANKDLVLTEDSPGTVNQLAKGSDYFRGMTIMGGVNLKTDGCYVYDREAVAALRKALPPMPSVPAPLTGPAGKNSPVRYVPQSFSFDVGKQSYSVVPQHTLTSGKDSRGIRYQTDLALRNSGRPGLELVRYYNPRTRDRGEFGKGWRLLIPYRVKPADKATRKFLNAIIPQRMVVENLCTGQWEVLRFSEDRYAVAGYVPDKLASSQVVGLFLMSNASYRLADKLGNQFHFDPAGYLTDMFLSPNGNHHLHVEYVDDFTAAFAKAPYVVQPADQEQVPFLNARIPKRVKVTDLLHDKSEVLTFNDENAIPGYLPQDERTSRYRLLAILSNTGLQLVDKHGNQTIFAPDWKFDRMLPSPEQRMVRSIAMGGQKVTFAYTVNGSGEVIIASSSLSANMPEAPITHVVRYEHDNEGRLCRIRHSDAPKTHNNSRQDNNVVINQ